MVAQAAGGFFDRFGGFSGSGIGGSEGGSVDFIGVKGDLELGCEGRDERPVGIGLLTAKAVMKVGNTEDQAKFPALRCEGAEESDGVRAAGDTDCQAQAGTEQVCVEGEFRLRGRGHVKMIRRA